MPPWRHRDCGVERNRQARQPPFFRSPDEARVARTALESTSRLAERSTLLNQTQAQAFEHLTEGP